MAGNPEEGTTSVDDTFLETVWLHNRVFQQYSITNQTYLLPVDEDEQRRLEVLHNVLQVVFDNRLIFAPISRPRRILDCGYGTGAWAVAVGDNYPGCEVVGVDISPLLAPDELPGNVYLQVDDLNRRFTFPAHNFDIVRSSMMAAGIHANRWDQYLRDIYRVTRGGGYCQMIEMYYNVQSDNGSLSEDHALQQWSSRYLESMEGLKDLRIATRLPIIMRTAGFVDVEHRMIQIPTCAWSNDPRENRIGAANRENVYKMLASVAIHPFIERLGMSFSDVQMLVAQARLEADTPAFKAYFPLYVCIGRKPRSRR